MVKGNLRQNSWVKAEQRDPKELCSAVYFLLRCVFIICLVVLKKVVCAYSPLLNGRSLSSCM